MSAASLPGVIGAADSSVSSHARSTTFNPGLQGMRGLAILLVLLNHAHVPGFGGGFVGVDVFFVISGYLIGGLLMRELDARGRIDLWAFFARRVRRLLPAAILVLALTLFGVRYLYAPQEQDELFSSIRAAALYAVNLWFASRPTDYFGGHTEANPALHLWSLAVEEQFYMVWPLLMLGFARLTRRGAWATTIWLLAVLGIASFAGCVVVSLINYKYTFFLTPFRIWEFAAGMAVMAWAPALRRWNDKLVSWVGALALGGLALVSLTFDGRMQFPGHWAAFPVVAAALLLLNAERGSATWVGRCLEARWIRWLGDCSYSVYLWHWPVLIVATQFVAKPDAALTVALLGASVLLGRASYCWIEQPVLRGWLQDWSPKRVLLAGAILCVAVVGATQLVRRTVHVGPEQEHYQRAARWDVVDKTGCLTIAAAEDQPPCVFGSSQPTATVVLFGDSHASQWFLPLNQLAEKHRLRLVVLTKAACPSADVTVAVYTTLAEYRECNVWRERMFKRIEALKPEVVVLANSSGYSFKPEPWQAGLERTLTRLRGMGVQVGSIRDIPFPGFDVPVCHARSAWRGWALDRSCTYLDADDLARIGPLARAEQAALARHGATFIDLTEAICGEPVCKTLKDGLLVFKDRNHLTEEFALHLAPRLEPTLLQLLKAGGAR